MKKKMIKKIALAFVGCVVLCYMLYQVYRSARHEVKTEPAVMCTLKDSIETKGTILRNEELVYWNGNGTLMNLLGDGEKVSKGAAVSEVYSSEDQAACMIELREIEKEINGLKGLNMLSGIALRGPDYLDRQINEELRNINLFGKVGKYKEVGKAREKALYLLNERHVVMGKVDNFSARLEELENKRKDLLKECGNETGKILSENSGYFVSQIDGYENLINYKDIKGLRPSDLQFEAISLNQESKNVAGKIIKSVDWYIVCKISLDDAMRLNLGETVDVELNSVFSENIPAKVVAINKEDETQEAALILSCDRMSKELSLIRNEDISVNINTYKGLRIAKSALKESVVSKETENNGEKEKVEKKVKGVYVKYGSNLIFKEVVPVYMDSSYIICRPNPGEEELFSDDTIQIGDEVVTEGIDLYEGKHIE